MTVLPEPSDKGSQGMAMPADRLRRPSRGLMSVEIHGNEVLCVHENSSLASGETDAFDLWIGRIWLQD